MIPAHIRTVGLLVAVAASTACWPRTFEVDHPEIQSRYRYQNEGTCSSWLRSHVTGLTYCASPPVAITYTTSGGGPAFAVPPLPKDQQVVTQEALVARGASVYEKTCMACHMADGRGQAGSFPPLAGAGSFYGDPVHHATIIKKGLNGKIEVLGASFDGVMPPQALDDYDIAAVATFERNSFGNSDGIVTPEDVQKVK